MLAALGFLTVVPAARRPTAGTVLWFAPVGALLGAVLGLVWWGAGELWTVGLAAALVLVVDLGLTGLLHVDGLADSADGLLPHLPRERRLAVMAQPDVGAFGVATVGATLLVRWAALAALPVDGWRAVVALAAIWATARHTMAIVLTAVPYAREGGGLASAFQGAGTHVASLTPAVLGVTFAAAFWARPAAAVGLVLGLVVAWGVVHLARRRLGGFTGDVLGAVCVLVETVALVVTAVDW